MHRGAKQIFKIFLIFLRKKLYVHVAIDEGESMAKRSDIHRHVLTSQLRK